MLIILFNLLKNYDQTMKNDGKILVIISMNIWKSVGSERNSINEN